MLPALLTQYLECISSTGKEIKEDLVFSEVGIKSLGTLSQLLL